MKMFGSSLFGQALTAAGVGAALMLSVSAGYTQSSGPFAGFDGNWAGTGTVALSNGTTENIRCKADYKVNANGLGLKQNLHCASDSYKFDLSSDVTSQGDRISGNWSEKSRNIFGNLQGTAGGGQIDVFVEASGFAANLNLRTNGNKQIVQISSKGEIRGVNITLTKSLIERSALASEPGSVDSEPGSFSYGRRFAICILYRLFCRLGVSSGAADLFPQIDQPHRRRPQDEEIRDQGCDHRERAEPAEQPQRRQVGKHRHDQAAGQHHRGQDQRRADQHGGAFDRQFGADAGLSSPAAGG